MSRWARTWAGGWLTVDRKNDTGQQRAFICTPMFFPFEFPFLLFFLFPRLAGLLLVFQTRVQRMSLFSLFRH